MARQSRRKSSNRSSAKKNGEISNFQNRQKQLRIFEDLLLETVSDPGPARTLVFHGMGGNGKSALIKQCREMAMRNSGARESFHNLLISGFEFSKQERPPTVIEFLLGMRETLHSLGLKTLGFDFGYLLYQTLKPQYGTLSIRFGESTQAQSAGEVIGNIAASLGEGLGGGASQIAQEFFLGATPTAVRKSAIKLHEIAKRRNQMRKIADLIPEFYIDLNLKNNLLPAEQFVAAPLGGSASYLLAYALAQDVNRELGEGKRLLLFVDEYETVLHDRERGGAINDVDGNLREFTKYARGLMVVVGSRYKLDWREEKVLWDDDEQISITAASHIPIAGLKKCYAKKYLIDSGVQLAPELIEAVLFNARESNDPETAYYPIALVLQLEHIIAQYSQNTPKNLENYRFDESDANLDDETARNRRLQWIASRLKNDYSDNFGETLDILSVCSVFDRDVIEALAEKNNFQNPAGVFDRAVKLPFFTEVGSGLWCMHGVVSEAFRNNLAPYVAKRCHQTIADIFKKRAGYDNKRDHFSPRNLSGLRFAMAHMAECETLEDQVQFLMPFRKPLGERGFAAHGLRLWEDIEERAARTESPKLDDKHKHHLELSILAFKLTNRKFETLPDILEAAEALFYPSRNQTIRSLVWMISFAPNEHIASDLFGHILAKCQDWEFYPRNQLQMGLLALLTKTNDRNYDSAADAVADLSKLGVESSEMCWSQLIRLAPNFATVQDILIGQFGVMQGRVATDLAPSVRVLTRKKAKTAQDLQWIQEHLGKSDSLQEHNAMLKTFPTMRDAQGYIESEMVAKGIEPSIVTWTELLKLASSFEGALAIYDKIPEPLLAEDEHVYTSMLGLANTWEQVVICLEKMDEFNVSLNDHHFFKVRTGDVTPVGSAQLVQVLDRLPNSPLSDWISGALNNWMKKVPAGAFANDPKRSVPEWIDVFKVKGLPVPDSLVARMLEDQKDYRSSQEVWGWLATHSQFDEKTLASKLISKTDSIHDLDLARSFLEERNIPPQDNYWALRISLLSNTQNLEEIANEMYLLNIPFERQSQEALVQLADGFDDLKWVIEGLADKGYTISCASKALSKAQDVQEAITLWKIMRRVGTSLDNKKNPVESLVTKATTLGDLTLVEQFLRHEDVKLIDSLFEKKLKLNGSLDRMEEIDASLAKSGLPRSVGIWRTIIQLSPNFDAAVQVVEEMTKERCKLNPSVIACVVRHLNSMEEIETFEDMVNQQGWPVDSTFWNAMTRTRAREQTPGEIMDWQQTACPDFPQVLASAIDVYKEAGYLSRAAFIAKAHPELHGADEVLTAYAERHEKAHNLQSAIVDSKDR